MKQQILLLLLAVSVQLFAQIKVACVGNSITFGSGIKGRDSLAYPPQLAKMLGAKWEVQNFGNSGSTMLKVSNKPYWEQKEYKAALKFQPDVVVIKLGTNDSKPYNWDGHKQDYMADYKAMITKFRSLKSKPMVFVCLPIIVVEDRWDIRKSIVETEVIEAILDVSKEMQTPVIDLHITLQDHPELIPDKIHPNAEGSKLMAEDIYDVLEANKYMIQARIIKNKKK